MLPRQTYHNMKTKTTLLFLCMLLTVACTRKSCPTEVIYFADSTDYCVTTLSMELPTGTSAVDSAICETLLAQLDLETRGAGPQPLFNAYKGDRGDHQACVHYYAQQLTDALNAIAEADESYYPWECRIKVSKVSQTNRYVVFRSENYFYLGGAHGGITGAGPMTFSLKTGEQIMPFFTSDAQAALQGELRKGLLTYFHQFEPELTEAKMIERLFIEDGIIPLPKYEPEPTEEGLRLIYQQYEIAPYSEGMPQFVLPYDVAEPLLTPKAKEILTR